MSRFVNHTETVATREPGPDFDAPMALRLNRGAYLSDDLSTVESVRAYNAQLARMDEEGVERAIDLERADIEWLLATLPAVLEQLPPFDEEAPRA